MFRHIKQSQLAYEVNNCQTWKMCGNQHATTYTTKEMNHMQVSVLFTVAYPLK